MLRSLLAKVVRPQPIIRRSRRWFSDDKPTIRPRNNNLKDSEARTKPINLSEQCISTPIPELAVLSTIEPYSRALHHMQREQLTSALSCLRSTENQLQRKHEQHLNLRIYLLNRKSIVLKMLSSRELAACMRQIFFSSVALNGYMSPDNLKHLSNMMLAQLYHDYAGAVAMVEHLESDADLPKFYLPTLRFYKSVVYGLREETIGQALETVSLIEPNQSTAVYLKNNLAWISLWANQNSRPAELKDSLEQSLKLFKQTLLDAEMNDVEQMEFTREAAADSLIKYILEAPLKNRAKLKLDRIRLANRNSHVICMNIGEVEMYLNHHDEASFWLQLAMYYAGTLNQFDRVVKSMVLTGRILDAGGFDQRAEGVYLDILFNNQELPDHSRRHALSSYAEFLHKRGRYYESVGYFEQLGPDRPIDSIHSKLEGLLLPDYDFSF